MDRNKKTLKYDKILLYGGVFKMAKKGQKFKNYSSEFKIEVAETYLNGTYGGRPGVAKHFGVGQTRVYEWVKIYREQGTEGFVVETRGRNSTGRPKTVNLDEMTLEEQVEYLKMEVDILKKVKALLKD